MAESKHWNRGDLKPVKDTIFIEKLENNRDCTERRPVLLNKSEN